MTMCPNIARHVITWAQWEWTFCYSSRIIYQRGGRRTWKKKDNEKDNPSTKDKEGEGNFKREKGKAKKGESAEFQEEKRKNDFSKGSPPYRGRIE